MAGAFKVTGKTAIITGAGSGINLEYAALLLTKGCNVVIGDLSLLPEAKKVYEGYATGSPRAVFVQTDVRDWTHLSRLFEVAEAEFGDIDIVTPGAGIFEPTFSSFWHPPGVEGSQSKDPVDGFGHYASLDINLNHPIRMTQIAISYFLNPTKGRKQASVDNPKRILHIASIASEIAVLPVPLYCASKWAVSGFVRCFDTLEGVNGIRVAAVAPGIVKTPIWFTQPDKLAFFDDAADDWVSPEEVATAMLKMLEDPEMVGGTVLEIGHNQTRVIPTFGNPGPQGSGTTVTNIAAGYGTIMQTMGTPGWGVVKK